MSLNLFAKTWNVSLVACLLAWFAGCVCEHRVPRGTCAAPDCTAGCAEPHNYAAYLNPYAGGYNPVCWQRWPNNWDGCPACDWEQPESVEPEPLLPGYEQSPGHIPVIPPTQSSCYDHRDRNDAPVDDQRANYSAYYSPDLMSAEVDAVATDSVD